MSSATALTVIPAVSRHSGLTKVTPVVYVSDGADVDRTIMAAVAGKYLAVLGMSGCGTNAATLTWKSDTTTLSVWDHAAKTSVQIRLSDKPVLLTKKGEALKISSSGAAGTFLIFVGEFSQLDIGE